MSVINKEITMYIDGLGIAFYSPGMVTNIPSGSDFLTQEFNRPEDIANHIRTGDITAFCTGASGQFTLLVRDGYPDDTVSEAYPVAIRLGIQVKGGKINIVDLFWLMEFSTECPPEQIVELADGFYHMTVLTRRPETGIWGDKQTIFIYFDKLSEMPELAWTGAPLLFTE